MILREGGRRQGVCRWGVEREQSIDRLIDPSIGILKGGEGIDRSGGKHSLSPRHDARVMHVMVMLLPPQSVSHRDHRHGRQAAAMVGGSGEDYGRREAACRRRRRTTTTMMTMGSALVAARDKFFHCAHREG
jgi:hypothetical protein